jgi:hypothetical protein
MQDQASKTYNKNNLGAYLDPQTNKYVQNVYSGGGGGGDGGFDNPGTMSGYHVYDQSWADGGDHWGEKGAFYNPDGTFSNEYDWSKDTGQNLALFLAAAGGLAFLPGGLASTISGASSAGAAGVGEAGWGMDLGMEGLAGATPSSGLGTTLAGTAGGALSAVPAAAGAGGGDLSLSQIVSGASTAGKLLGLGGGGGGSGVGMSDLGKLISGGLDYKRQNDSADKMLDWLKSRTAITDNLYQPGTPEYNKLWDEMSRKDAAAGRNSQYGPRSVDLAARIAQIKSDANTRMTTGIGQWMNGAYDQKANSIAGLTGALGNMGGGGSSGSLLDLINSYYKNYGTSLNFEDTLDENLFQPEDGDYGQYF